jgi:hypothetical protein
MMVSCHTLEIVDSSGIENEVSTNTNINNNDFVMMLGRRGNYKPRKFRDFKQALFGDSELPKIPINPALIYMSPTGNNSTGRVGDITRPFQTLAGVNAVYTNETIYVMAGVYSEEQNLAIADGVKYYFEDGADTNYYIDTEGLGYDVEVSGKGQFSPSRTAFIYPSNEGVIRFEGEKVVGLRCVQHRANDTMEVYVDLDYYEGSHLALSAAAGSEGVIDIKCKRAKCTSSEIFYGPHNDVEVSIHVNYLELAQGANAMASIYQLPMSNSQLNLRVDNLITTNNSGRNTLMFFLQDSGSASMDSLNYNVSIGNYRGNWFLNDYFNTNGGVDTTNLSIHFNCDNCVYTGDESFVFNESAGFPNGGKGERWLITGNYFSYDSPILLTDGTPTQRYTFMGYYKIFGSGVNAFEFADYNDGRIDFVNCYIDVNGGSAITSTSPMIINASNLGSNGSIGANITINDRRIP